MAKFLNIAVIVIGGVMLADLVAHPSGTGTLINGVTGLWKSSVNGLLGSTS